jgi:hypothetical protein
MQAAFQSVKEGRYLLIYGGRGTLKTSTLVMALAIELKILTSVYRGYRLLVAAMTHDQLLEVFLAAWTSLVDPADLDWHYDHARRKVKLPNDGEITLRHAGDESGSQSAVKAARKARGGNYHGLYLPEATSISESFYNSTRAAVRGAPVGYVKGQTWEYQIRWFDANPDSPEHWLYRRFLNDKAPEAFAPTRKLVLGYPTTPTTSAWTVEDIAEMRAGWPSHEAARMLDAEWTGASGAILPLRTGVQVTPEPLPPGGKWFLTFDFGYEVDPYVALLIYRHGKHAHVVSEIARTQLFRDSPNGGMLGLVQAMLDAGQVIEGVTGDLAGVKGGGWQEQAWWAEQFNSEVVYTKKDRYAGWLRLIKATQICPVGSSRPGLTIDPECKGLIASLSSLTWNAKGSDINPVKGDDHADALRYFVMSDASPVTE